MVFVRLVCITKVTVKMEAPSSLPATSPAVPPSPGACPINLSDGIEKLLFFTLSSSPHGSLEVDLLLSRDYYRRLIQDDPHPEILIDFVAPCATGDSVGIPFYPLYKHLACRIERWINQGDLEFCKPTVGCAQSGFLNQKEKDWKKLIADVGSELINMFNSVNFEFHVQEPFFSQLGAGQKTVEGRCAEGIYKRIAPGNVILINKCLLLQVQYVKFYDSFSEMLEFETLTSVLPGVETIEEGVQVYRKFYSEEKEKMNGVLAISISRATTQPYILMAKLLNGLSYEGIASLLGLAHTAGTVPDSLPPAVSVLISSFISLHRPEFVGFVESYMKDGLSRRGIKKALP